MENTLLEIIRAITNHPINFTIDLTAHLTSGYLVTKTFMPNSQGLEKHAYSIAAGFLPDMDFLTFGTVPHRTFTHTLTGALSLPFSISPSDTSTQEKSLTKKLYNWSSSKIKSPEFRALTTGCALHLAVDSMESSLIQLTYAGMAAVTTCFLKEYKI